MSDEGQEYERKSLKLITGNKADWGEIARQCVCFANAQGGHLIIGIEDQARHPPTGQGVSGDLVERVRKRIGELTVNVVTAIQRRVDPQTGGAYIDVRVFRSTTHASTTDGRFCHRIADDCRPLVGTEIQRLLSDRNAQSWETMDSAAVPRSQVDARKRNAVCGALRASGRVKDSVREKSDDELLDHYFLTAGKTLTNLGVLCIGKRIDRARLSVAPVVQAIKYDSEDNKIRKDTWDDHSLSPVDLVETIWQGVPDFHETYELPDGLFRQEIPAYDKRVVRELLVNALVHRPYTQGGDIYLNLHPDRLEIVNPGLLPLGVTPRNILHQSVRRNPQLARLFHDLGLMENEGSGYDLLYEVLTSQGRPVPQVAEGPDSVSVTVPRRIVSPKVIDFIHKTAESFSLSQRERIALGILVQHDALTRRELMKQLELPDDVAFNHWIHRLVELKLVRQTGRTKGTRYFVDPVLLDKLEFPTATTLTRIEPYRLKELVLEDLKHHPGSAFGEIHTRIGREIPDYQVRRSIHSLADAGSVTYEGEKRWRRYWRA